MVNKQVKTKIFLTRRFIVFLSETCRKCFQENELTFELDQIDKGNNLQEFFLIKKKSLKLSIESSFYNFF